MFPLKKIKNEALLIIKNRIELFYYQAKTHYPHQLNANILYVIFKI